MEFILFVSALLIILGFTAYFLVGSSSNARKLDAQNLEQRIERAKVRYIFKNGASMLDAATEGNERLTLLSEYFSEDGIAPPYTVSMDVLKGDRYKEIIIGSSSEPAMVVP